MDFIGCGCPSHGLGARGPGPRSEAGILTRLGGQGCLERGHRRLVREPKKRLCLLDLESSAKRCCSSCSEDREEGQSGAGSVLPDSPGEGPPSLNLCPAQPPFPSPLEHWHRIKSQVVL